MGDFLSFACSLRFILWRRAQRTVLACSAYRGRQQSVSYRPPCKPCTPHNPCPSAPSSGSCLASSCSGSSSSNRVPVSSLFLRRRRWGSGDCHLLFITSVSRTVRVALRFTRVVSAGAHLALTALDQAAPPPLSPTRLASFTWVDQLALGGASHKRGVPFAVTLSAPWAALRFGGRTLFATARELQTPLATISGCSPTIASATTPRASAWLLHSARPATTSTAFALAAKPALLLPKLNRSVILTQRPHPLSVASHGSPTRVPSCVPFGLGRALPLHTMATKDWFEDELDVAVADAVEAGMAASGSSDSYSSHAPSPPRPTRAAATNNQAGAKKPQVCTTASAAFRSPVLPETSSAFILSLSLSHVSFCLALHRVSNRKPLVLFGVVSSPPAVCFSHRE